MRFISYMSASKRFSGIHMLSIQLLNFEHWCTVYNIYFNLFSSIAIIVKRLFTRVPRGRTGRVQLIKYVYMKKRIIFHVVGTGSYPLHKSLGSSTATSRQFWSACTGSLFAIESISKLTQLLSRYSTTTSLFTLLKFFQDTHLHDHSGSSSVTISAPFRKTSMVTSKSFSSTASRVWNKLPTHVSFALTLPVFRRHLKAQFFP